MHAVITQMMEIMQHLLCLSSVCTNLGKQIGVSEERNQKESELSDRPNVQRKNMVDRIEVFITNTENQRHDKR